MPKVILLDDYEAREIARNYRLNITGTIGVLIRDRYSGEIDNLKEELEKLKETGFWLSEELYTKILREEREQK